MFNVMALMLYIDGKKKGKLVCTDVKSVTQVEVNNIIISRLGE
jgi:hypothetical protein